MKNLLLLTLAAMLAAPLSAQAAIVFQDTFNTPATTDLNFDVAGRQAGGTVGSTYTFTAVTGGNDISNSDFRAKANATNLDTNFASNIGVNDFTLSIDGRIATGGSDWVSFSMLSANETSRGSTDFSFLMRGNDNIVVSNGGGANVTLNKATIQALGGANSTWDSGTFANYAFVATAADANTGSIDFQINGISATTVTYAFTESTTRTLNWTNLGATAVGRWDNVTLDVVAVPEPSSLALLAFGSLGMLIRRKGKK